MGNHADPAVSLPVEVTHGHARTLTVILAHSGGNVIDGVVSHQHDGNAVAGSFGGDSVEPAVKGKHRFRFKLGPLAVLPAYIRGQHDQPVNLFVEQGVCALQKAFLVLSAA